MSSASSYDSFSSGMSYATSATSLPPLPSPKEPSNPPTRLEIWVGQTDHRDQPEHWVLMVRAPGSKWCTMYHATAEAASSHIKYSVTIDCGEVFEHASIPFREKISVMKPQMEATLREAARSIDPTHCQRFVVALLEKLEDLNMVPRWTAAWYKPKIQPLLNEGPVREISKKEHDRLVAENGGLEKAIQVMLRIQGWVNEKGDILWRTTA
ncbi:hypothetical protein BJY01DRAFT_256035 [Aspergillus pseudoustus]|uniref:Uncharacterized protein n=1 Tax=Aspergillus pseudoustus TaxID=1810923 RepID=A0ABR4IEZ4_9EURO